MKKIMFTLMLLFAISLGGCTTLEAEAKRKAESKKYINDFEFRFYKKQLKKAKGSKEKFKVVEYTRKPYGGSKNFTENQRNEMNSDYEKLKKEIEIIKKLEEEKNKMIAKKMRKSSKWVNGYFVDNYGERTGEEYFVQTSIGKFSNSATRKSDLLAISSVQLGKSFTIELKEYSKYYSDNRPKATFIGGYIYTYMINEKGDKFKITDKVYSSQNYTNISGNEFDNLIKFFKKSEIIRIHTVHNSSSYNFELNTKIIK